MGIGLIGGGLNTEVGVVHFYTYFFCISSNSTTIFKNIFYAQCLFYYKCEVDYCYFNLKIRKRKLRFSDLSTKMIPESIELLVYIYTLLTPCSNNLNNSEVGSKHYYFRVLGKQKNRVEIEIEIFLF